MLLRFDHFLQSHTELASNMLNQLIETWVHTIPPKPSLGGKESGTTDVESDASARSRYRNPSYEYRNVSVSTPRAEAPL